MILDVLSPADAATLRSYASIAEPVCPDVFKFRRGDQLLDVTASDIVDMGALRPPRRDEQWLFHGSPHQDIDDTAKHLFGRRPDRTFRPPADASRGDTCIGRLSEPKKTRLPVVRHV